MDFNWVAILVPFLLFFVLLAIGVPIGVTLGVCGFTGYAIVDGFYAAFIRLGSISVEGMANYILSPIPLFVLMGEFVVVSGLGAKLYEAVWRLVGRLPGGLSIASIMACTLISAMSGLSATGIVALGAFAIPEMMKRGYSVRLASGSLVGGSTLGILIPPSVPFILYGVLAEQSIGRLFIAGVIPGLLISGMFIVYVVALVTLNPSAAPRMPVISWRERLAPLKGIWPVFVLIFLVLGTIYLGVCSPTEAAGMGALGSLCIAYFYKKLTLSVLWEVLRRTAGVCGLIFIIIIGGLYFGYFVTVTGFVKAITVSVINLEISRWWIIVGINFLLLILGCMMDSSSIILVTTPLFYPIIVDLGFNPIWYGVILCINMEMSFITPPVGLNLYTVKAILPDISLEDILKGSLPFCTILGIGLALIMIFPQLALWLTQFLR